MAQVNMSPTFHRRERHIIWDKKRRGQNEKKKTEIGKKERKQGGDKREEIYFCQTVCDRLVFFKFKTLSAINDFSIFICL